MSQDTENDSPKKMIQPHCLRSLVINKLYKLYERQETDLLMKNTETNIASKIIKILKHYKKDIKNY